MPSPEHAVEESSPSRRVIRSRGRRLGGLGLPIESTSTGTLAGVLTEMVSPLGSLVLQGTFALVVEVVQVVNALVYSGTSRLSGSLYGLILEVRTPLGGLALEVRLVGVVRVLRSADNALGCSSAPFTKTVHRCSSGSGSGMRCLLGRVGRDSGEAPLEVPTTVLYGEGCESSQASCSTDQATKLQDPPSIPLAANRAGHLAHVLVPYIPLMLVKHVRSGPVGRQAAPQKCCPTVDVGVRPELFELIPESRQLRGGDHASKRALMRDSTVAPPRQSLMRLALG